MSWWDFLSGFEDAFTEEEWYEDSNGWGYVRVTTEKHSGTHSAEPNPSEIDGALWRDIGCVPDSYYALRVWFKIIGTVPTSVSGAILTRMVFTDLDDWQLYIETGNIGNPATPKLRLDFKTTTVRGTTSISLNEWHCLHIKQFVNSATAKTEIYLDDLETPEIFITKDLTGITPTKIIMENVFWAGAYNGKVYIDSIIGSCDAEGEFPNGNGNGNGEPLIHSVITRVKSITIGKSANDTYEWFGVNSINWEDASPWVHIDIPSGLMIHQNILSPIIRGVIKCKDLATLHTALFETTVDPNNHTAICAQQSNRKYSVVYFKVTILNELNEPIDVMFDGFKVETIGVENIELGTESVWVIKFVADRVVIGV